jgi:sialidase-1
MMKSLIGLLVAILIGLVCFGAELRAQNCASLSFLGPASFSIQPLWNGTEINSLVTAHDGSVLVFRAGQNNQLYRSPDAGKTWDTTRTVGVGASDGNAVVNEMNGEVLYLVPSQSSIYRSTNHGLNWTQQSTTITPDTLGFTGVQVGSVQAGITLMRGSFPGRLIMPSRLLGPQNSDQAQWRRLHYASSIYSDDGGATWTTSRPFPVMGTAEGAIVELTLDGLLYSAREQISLGGPYFATCPDTQGGDVWLYQDRQMQLPDGPRGSPFGNVGGLIHLPMEGLDVLLYSNVDSMLGELPQQVGGTSTNGRERVTVWVSLDGGRSWPIKRPVFDGPAGASYLAAGREGTASDGLIFLLFEGGPGGWNSGVQLATFNLSWLLDGKDIHDYLVRPRSIFWTGQGDRFGGSSTAQNLTWSSGPYWDEQFPKYTLIQQDGIDPGQAFSLVFDRDRMLGNNSTVRMNRDDVQMLSIELRGSGSQGMQLTNSDGNGNGLKLAGPVVVAGGSHSFLAPSSGRVLTMTKDGCWDIQAESTLVFSHSLAGPYSVRKTGSGRLLLSGHQYLTGSVEVEEGVIGAGTTSAVLSGDLMVCESARYQLSTTSNIEVLGMASFERYFRINRLDGLSHKTPPGRYPLITGQVEMQNVRDIGASQAISLGNRKIAYFENSTELVLIVEDLGTKSNSDVPRKMGTAR